MQAANLSYGFNIMHFELMETTRTLWGTAKAWGQAHPGLVAANNAMPGLLKGYGDGAYWHGCHWWGHPACSSAPARLCTRVVLPSGWLTSGGALLSGRRRWSNFELGRLSFFRSEAYRSFFSHLDRSGGFFYER